MRQSVRFIAASLLRIEKLQKGSRCLVISVSWLEIIRTLCYFKAITRLRCFKRVYCAVISDVLVRQPVLVERLLKSPRTGSGKSSRPVSFIAQTTPSFHIPSCHSEPASMGFKLGVFFKRFASALRCNLIVNRRLLPLRSG